mmetsp:Transcript_1584/g.2230  ORF Transcript_1584/g.2230 Transcript_1584/m.2230 type:complete len:93 (+) Transcript_1584:60-338(+)
MTKIFSRRKARNTQHSKDGNNESQKKVKHSHHRRKVVWDKVAEMVRGGWSADEACNKIYEVYGANKTVTSIINEMRRDRKNGDHPSLHVCDL